MYKIVKYNTDFENELIDMIKLEGDDWGEYWKEPTTACYRETVDKSITYLALADGKVCGYSRSILDGLYIYVCDLLVTGRHRGNGLGEKLMRCLQEEYPDKPVYIMSGNDGYYNTIPSSREGSVYLLK